MAALFLVRTDDPGFAEQALATATREGAPADGITPASFAFPGWRGLHWPMAMGGPEALLRRGDDLVAVAGTISVDGLMGRPALERLLDMPGLPRPDWTRIAGQFVALVRRGGRAWLFTDWFAAFQLFHDTGHRLFSTSLLAAAQSLPRLSFDPQGLYEWAFNAAALGDDTIFAELKTLGPRVAIELGEHGTTLHPLAKDLPEQTTRELLPDRLARHRAALEAAVAPAVAQFGDRVICPLSGGIDSRLALAALHAAGSRPHRYVYGPPGSPDVEIALAIGRAQGFPVEWINKQAAPLAPDAFPEQVARNFRDGDGLPNYGNIFDNGGNSAAQAARHAGGALAVSGGCGEIYRDFFYLPDRPMRAFAIAATFFARFVRGDATDLFDPHAFLSRIAGKIAEAVGVPDDNGPIPRAMVEQVYPRVRCRALFGREISMEGRLGAYLMPFLDHRVVAEAMTLPIALKPAGRFEAALLHAIDPVLAAQPSAYGHHFAGPPSRRHRWEEWSSRHRPTWLRRHSYAIRRRLGPVGDEHGGLLAPDYMGRVIDLEMPAMRRFFHVDRITDSGLWRRVACLEYLAGVLGGRLTTSAS